MGMSIMSDISALAALRNSARNENSLANLVEKLSSGYRINRAADDPAGLTISELLRS